MCIADMRYKNFLNNKVKCVHLTVQRNFYNIIYYNNRKKNTIIKLTKIELIKDKGKLKIHYKAIIKV